MTFVSLAAGLTTRALRRPRPALVAAASLLLSGSAAAQGLISPACQEACPNALTDPVGAAACTARVSLCQSKLTLYQSYMAQLGLGVSRASLPGLYLQILQPHYPGVSLPGYRFGFGDRQPPSNSTTDCTVTYYNPNATYASRLATGQLTSDGEMALLFHELAHVEQCMQVGGRDRYARMWFEQAELAFLQSADLAAIHDLQPMENQATDKANAVLAATRRNRNSEGRFIPPQPDLLVARLAMVSNTRAGYCTLRITLENAGTAPIPGTAYANAAAVVRVTAGTANLGEFSLAQLDPNGILRRTPPQNVAVTWRPGSVYTFNGFRSFLVTSDPSAVISDANRNNNRASTTLNCTVAPLTPLRRP